MLLTAAMTRLDAEYRCLGNPALGARGRYNMVYDNTSGGQPPPRTNSVLKYQLSFSTLCTLASTMFFLLSSLLVALDNL